MSMRSFLSLMAALGSSLASANGAAPPVGHSAVIDPSASYGPTTNVNFVDPCNNQVIVMAPPDKGQSPDLPAGRARNLLLVTEITGLTPGVDVWVRTEISSKTPLVSESQNKGQTNEDTYRAGADGKLRVERAIDLYRWKKPTRSSLVTAAVQWAQKAPASKAGGGSTTLGFISNESAYRVTSEEVCRWETPVAITSEYRMNPSGGSEMTITREEELVAYVSRSQGYGVGLGQFIQSMNGRGIIGVTPVNAAFPFNDMKSPVGGWFYDQWYTTFGSRRTDSVAQKWLLHPGDGGFFGSRLHFIRYVAQEFVPAKINGCTQWTSRRTGYLDVGIPSTTLFTVPKALASKPAEAAAFMERVQPRITSCPDQGVGASTFAVPGGSDGLLFFYPKGDK